MLFVTKGIGVIDLVGQRHREVSECIHQHLDSDLCLPNQLSPINADIKARSVALKHLKLLVHFSWKQARSRFLSNISHEMHALPNRILEFSQALKRDRTLIHRQTSSLPTIHQFGLRLPTLINKIFALDKIEAHRLEIHSTTFDCQTFLNDIITATQTQAIGSTIRFQPEVLLNLSTKICGNEIPRQILLSLLGNAIKFIEQSQVTPRICSECPCLEVPVERLPINSNKQSRDAQHQSTGTSLGLATSQQRTEITASRLKVVSKWDGESNFWVEGNFLKIVASVVLSIHYPHQPFYEALARQIEVLYKLAGLVDVQNIREPTIYSEQQDDRYFSSTREHRDLVHKSLEKESSSLIARYLYAEISL